MITMMKWMREKRLQNNMNNNNLNFMKTTFLITGLLVLFISVNAQQDSILTDAKNRKILPEGKDFAVGISINPIFNYFGNTFNGSQYNSLNLGLLNNQLYGKYFLSNSQALRFRLGIRTTRKDIQATINYTKINLEETFSEVDLTTGYEIRKGKTRLQYFYGGEISFAFEDVKHDYDYTGFLPDNIGLREAEGLGVSFRGFFGVEYFVFSKISVGGECGLGVVSTNTFNSPKRKFSVNTDILGGQIFMLFHFGN